MRGWVECFGVDCLEGDMSDAVSIPGLCFEGKFKIDSEVRSVGEEDLERV